MSDELSTGAHGFMDDTDELSVALREFAAEQEARPVLTGAEVRGRAVRRARRRMAGTLGAGAVALALVGLALTLDLTGKDDGRQLPGAATPAVPSQSQAPTPSPSAASAAVPTPVSTVPATGTLDLAKRALTVGDRVMPLTSDSSNRPALVGPLTVYRKHDTKVLAGTTEILLAVELRDAHNEPVYVGVTTFYKRKSLGTQGTGGWIGLDGADAKWFYQDAKIGSVLSVTGD
ncbi:hypothetical protein OH768_27510 [Streptomyces sp. NBC_01622]|uniref:hypothetical protein n=1 Tax=Streptomyces sp. NBC_01622 TaxID=2975903 RepID=UPI00386CF3BC|nr:hypothetical protein OH768_27510 [Streptomyces sp. NBC_01622]